MNFFFDVETTGLPAKKTRNCYKDIKNLDGARMLSICWIITHNNNIIEQSYYIIKPDGFLIPQSSIDIHGITQEQADVQGVSISIVLDMIKEKASKLGSIISHNIDFDKLILMGELYRYGYHDVIEELDKKHFICTMKKGKEYMGGRKFPKLSELYRHLYGEDIKNAHNAQYDTFYCYKCYLKMFPPSDNEFFFGNKCVKLTDEQKEVVLADHDKNMLVVACAGSGKCHAYDTNIMMYNGKVKKVQEIIVGDLVLGDDNKQRIVIDTGTGYGQMFMIKPRDNDPFVVNGDHILVLTFRIPKVSFSSLKQMFFVRTLDDNNKLVKTYFEWFNDAIKYVKSKGDKNIEISVFDYLLLPRKVKKYLFLTYSGIVNVNILGKSFKKRLDYLATIIDENGCYDNDNTGYKYNINIHKELVAETTLLIRSCGLIAKVKNCENEYYRVISIQGNIDIIPSKVYIKNAHHSYKNNIGRFKIIPQSNDKYYGFSLDGNHKYVLDSFIVNHNTTTTLCRIKHLLDSGVPENSIILTTFTRDAATDMKNKLHDILGYKPNLLVGTIDSIAKMYVERTDTNKFSKHVSEYSHLFLNYLKSVDDKFFARFKYMFIDEFQDINDVQYNIISEFNMNGIKIFAVGDDAQNIYTFRGSNIKYILNFDSYFHNTSIHKLTWNFRSNNDIIALANASILNNMNQIPKSMICGRTDIPSFKPEIRYFNNQTIHNNHILEHVMKLIDEGIELHDIVILSPLNNTLFMIEELFTKNNIKSVVLDGKSDVRTSIKRDHICLSTIHKSKGLEWKIVILANMSDDIIPKLKNDKAIEEDRRLFYVAVTRACEQLYIYYYANDNTPYVTRFVGELSSGLYNFIDAKPEYTSGYSDNDYFYIDKSVTKLIELLDGEDYAELRNQGIIPAFENTVKKTKLYPGCGYTPLITQEDLYSDFGIFIDIIITKLVALRYAIPFKSKAVLQTLAAVTINTYEFMIYRLYKYNMKINLLKAIPYVHSPKTFKRTLEKYAKPIASGHEDVLIKIVKKIHINSLKYNIEADKIPVFNFKFLPDGFDIVIQKAYKSCKEGKDIENIINDLWDISKCNLVVTEYRRRLLFKDIKGKDISETYMNMIDLIKEYFLPMFETNKNVAIHTELSIPDGIYGEVDIMTDNSIIEIKTSINEDLNLQWVLQLLCYKAMYEFDKGCCPIKYLNVFNPLKGLYYEIDVSGMTRQHGVALLNFLLKKRASLMNI